MFERFTDAARRVVVLAQEEARLTSANYLGTEHLLLGLIRQEDGIAALVLSSAGIELDQVRRRAGELAGAIDRPELSGPNQGGRLLFTPRAKKALQFSLRESLQIGHSFVDTEDLLLGLLREGDGVGAQVLAEHNVRLNDVRRQIITRMREAIPGAPALAVLPTMPIGRAGLTQVTTLLARISQLDSQVAALTAEVERLEALLRSHGIEPDADAG
jgi:ATP-dependent Clp protease ATP-binding subunit ClpA